MPSRVLTAKAQASSPATTPMPTLREFGPRWTEDHCRALRQKSTGILTKGAHAPAPNLSRTRRSAARPDHDRARRAALRGSHPLQPKDAREHPRDPREAPAHGGRLGCAPRLAMCTRPAALPKRGTRRSGGGTGTRRTARSPATITMVCSAASLIRSASRVRASATVTAAMPSWLALTRSDGVKCLQRGLLVRDYILDLLARDWIKLPRLHVRG